MADVSVQDSVSFRFDPLQPGFFDDPYPVYKQLRDHRPAVRDEATGCWLISRYDDVRRILLDTTTFSSAKGNTIIDSPLRVGKTMGSLDPPRHDELRRVVTPGLSNARIEAILPPLREHLKQVLADLAKRRACDVVADLGRPVLYGALGRMLGLDERGAVRAIELSKNLFNDGTGPTGGPLSPESFKAVFDFLSQEVVRRTTERGDDLISVLLTAKEAGAPLSDPEIVANMATVLLAGNASIGHFFTNMVYALWRHPDQRALVRSDLAKIGDAIEEGLRWDTSTQCFARQTTADVEVAGTAIPRDSRLIVLYASGNRDERAFPDPDRFDALRGRTRHLGFGAGRHFCFGAHAARQMLSVMFEEMLPVLGDYDLDMANAKRVPHLMARGFSTLPASW